MALHKHFFLSFCNFFPLLAAAGFEPLNLGSLVEFSTTKHTKQRLKFGLVFNYRSGCVYAMHLFCYEAIGPNLELKTKERVRFPPIRNCTFQMKQSTLLRQKPVKGNSKQGPMS